MQNDCCVQENDDIDDAAGMSDDVTMHRGNWTPILEIKLYQLSCRRSLVYQYTDYLLLQIVSVPTPRHLSPATAVINPSPDCGVVASHSICQLGLMLYPTWARHCLRFFLFVHFEYKTIAVSSLKSYQGNDCMLSIKKLLLCWDNSKSKRVDTNMIY